MARCAYQLFHSTFSDGNLRRLFDDKISSSLAVGRDGIRVQAFHRGIDREIGIIRRKVMARTYRFTRYKEKLIARGSGRHPRILSIPTVRDRLTLRALHELLGYVFETALTKKPHSFIKEIKAHLATNPSTDTFVRMDIKDYYPSIDVNLLVRIIKRRIRKKEVLHLIEAAVRTQTSDDEEVNGGVPQGLSISNILSSVYLDDFDRKMKLKWNYFRYVDDILIVCPESQATEAFLDVKRALKLRQLECHNLEDHSRKTYIQSTKQGAEYLGYYITRDTLSIRQSSLRRMFGTIQSVLTTFKYQRK